MRIRASTALTTQVACLHGPTLLMLGLLLSSTPCRADSQGPAESAASHGAATRYREARPQPTPGRRGLLSVPRWAMLGAGAGVVALGVLGLMRMRRTETVEHD